MRRRKQKQRRELWIGDFTSWNPMKPNSFVSSTRHEEPFNKRDRERRNERRFKLRQRLECLS